MRNLKWLKDKNGDLIAYAFKGDTRINLRIKKDFTYEGWLLQGSSFLTANNNVKVFTGKENTASKAIISATRSLYKYLGVSSNEKKAEVVEEKKPIITSKPVINNSPKKEEPKEVNKKVIKIFVHENEDSYELITNLPVDEIRYIRGTRNITSKKVKASVYENSISKERGVSYSAAAFIGDEVVANVCFGEKN